MVACVDRGLKTELALIQSGVENVSHSACKITKWIDLITYK